jgi:hypothetical protein
MSTLKASRPDEEKFEEVELAPHPNAGSHFFIEHTTFWSLVTTLLMLSAFIVMHTYAALRAPPILASKEEFFRLNNTDENVSIDVDITLSQLQEGHRFVVVNGSLIGRTTTLDKTLPIEVTTRQTLMKNYNVVNNNADEKRKYDLKFVPGTNQSSVFDVVRLTIGTSDTVQIRLTVQTDFTGIAGFLFHWDFANPSAEKYSKSAKLLMSFLIGYMLVVFAFYLKFDAESFTQIFLLIIGITGVFASNPLGYFLKSTGTGARVSDHILLAVFTAVFRLFLLLELEMLRAHSTAPKTILVVILAIFFGFYATVDAAAGYDRQTQVLQAESEVPIVLQTETALIAIDSFYVVVSLIYLIVAAIQNDGINSRRVWFFAFAVVATGGITILTQVVFVLFNKYLYSVLSSMLFCSVHITVASMAIFLLHSGGGPEYTEMPKSADNESMVLDADQASDDDDEEDEDDEE